jgi:hypothetical protein
MKTDIRQGIVKAQTSPSFVYFSGGAVGLDASQTPIVISFINGDTETLFIENKTIERAWEGPFQRDKDHWLYWDIDSNGVRTFGKTTVEPYKYNIKDKPRLDQHYFDYVTNQMKVWNGLKWEPKLRVFAAKVISGNSIKPFPLGSQNKTTSIRNSGSFIYVGDSILKSNTIFDFVKPISTQTDFHTQDYIATIEKEQLPLRAKEPIFKYAAISIVSQDLYAKLASYKDLPCIGLALESTLNGGKFGYIRYGVLEDFFFEQFYAKPGDKLWLNENGLLTKSPRTDGKLVQMIGEFITPRKVFINIQLPVYL